ncbi:MAG TPA: glutaminyl-peptide cyclotransferase [Candidatus Hydrogenedentes bacterium]|nr:glutaminyl-peptide cyclotransferase [Candidatus Hydrogenedentota bacterium]
MPQLPPADQPPPDTVTYYTYRVAESFPHDRNAFTQGLAFSNGVLYEGTGLYGESSIRKVEPATGEVMQIKKLPRAYFGEGVTVYENRLIQLTWKSQVGFIYDLETFERTGDFNYLGEGWGLTHDGRRFIMSDGSARLRFLDMKSLDTTGQIYVRFGDQPVTRLNELEYIDGCIYANIWKEDRIAIINPDSGYVIGWADMSGLLSAEEKKEADVLNGIAYDTDNQRLFVTGKRWPKLFHVELVEEKTDPYPAVSITSR